MAERVTLTQLRKLARQALGRGAEVAELGGRNHWHDAAGRDVIVTVRGDTKQAARLRLRDQLLRLVRGGGE